MTRAPLQRSSLARSLAAHPALASFEPPMLEFLTGCARNVRVRPGEYLFREGERADTLLLLRRGSLSLECHFPGRGPVRLESISAPEALGATALLAPYMWHVDALATTPLLAFAFDGACLRRKLAEDSAFGCALLTVMLRDVHSRLVRTRLAQLDVYGQRGAR